MIGSAGFQILAEIYYILSTKLMTLWLKSGGLNSGFLQISGIKLQLQVSMAFLLIIRKELVHELSVN